MRRIKFARINRQNKPSQVREKGKVLARTDAQYESAVERAALRRIRRKQKPRAKPSVFL